MTLSPNAATNAARLRRRPRRSRGAALVEAMVVVPVMVIILGMTFFVRDAYSDKYGYQTSTRAEMLYYASHDCEGGVPSAVVNQLAGNDSTGTTPSPDISDTTHGYAGRADVIAGKLRNSEQQGISRVWNFARTRRERSRTRKVVDRGEFVIFAGRIVVNSKVACNEKRFDNGAAGLLGVVRPYARSGAGLYP